MSFFLPLITTKSTSGGWMMRCKRARPMSKNTVASSMVIKSLWDKAAIRFEYSEYVRSPNFVCFVFVAFDISISSSSFSINKKTSGKPIGFLLKVHRPFSIRALACWSLLSASPDCKTGLLKCDYHA